MRSMTGRAHIARAQAASRALAGLLLLSRL